MYWRGYPDRFKAAMKRVLHLFPFEIPKDQGQYWPAIISYNYTAEDAIWRWETSGLATPGGSMMLK